MTATARSDNGWEIEAPSTLVHPGGRVPLAAAAQAGQGQAIYFGSGSANAALNDGTTANLVCAGVVLDKLAGLTTSIAGQETALVHQGTGIGQASSTLSNDAFVASDVLAVCYDAGNGVPGKLAVYGGNKRSIMGLVLGLASDGTPRVWAGPIASLLARSLLAATSKVLGWYAHPVDGSAGATTAEKSMIRAPLQGLITAVTFTQDGRHVVAGSVDGSVRLWRLPYE